MTPVKAILLSAVALIATAGSVAAQAPYEYDRASGGEIRMATKGSRSMSGTLGLKRGDGTELWDATFGGTLLEDRVWFFGAVEKSENRMFTQQPPGASTSYAGKADI